MVSSHKLVATFSNVCCLKCQKYLIFKQFRVLLELETGKFGEGGTWDTTLIAVDNLFENPARYTFILMLCRITVVCSAEKRLSGSTMQNTHIAVNMVFLQRRKCRILVRPSLSPSTFDQMI